MTAYEITEIAQHLMDGGWTGNDEAQFREENRKQDAENILNDDDISRVFEEIRTNEYDMMKNMVEDFVADNAEEMEDLITHPETARFDEDLDRWVMDAEDDKFTYLLVADIKGNISVHTLGVK